MKDAWNKKLNSGVIRNTHNIVNLQKPVVNRKGKNVTKCFFFQETGECFQERCFWKANGKCRFSEKAKEL